MIVTETLTALPEKRSRLVLISHSELFESVLQPYVQDNPGFELTRIIKTSVEQVEAELVLVDVASFSRDECVQVFRLFPHLPIALVNANLEVALQLIELHPWVKGVFYRSMSRTNFMAGVQAMLAGGDWLPRALMEKLVVRYRQIAHTSDAIAELTAREKQILTLAGQGLSNVDIAGRVYLSVHTIKSHIHNALRKLGATNRAQGAALVMGHIGEPER